MLEGYTELPCRVVYDKETGTIVHTHHTVVVPGAATPSEDDVDARAMLHATRDERVESELAILTVDPEDLKDPRDNQFSVDVARRELRVRPHTSRA